MDVAGHVHDSERHARRRARGGLYLRRVKPALDFVTAAFLLVLLGPLMAVIAIAVLAESGRPVLFRQERVGQHARRIAVIRFRTVDTRSPLWERTLAGEPVERAVTQPGITRLGRLLLRHRLDRLPELLNVCRGEMSLIGPRPVMPYELARYGHVDWVRLRVRPGLTCLWQVSEQHEGELELSRDIDRDYVLQVSPRLDVSIAARTLALLARRRYSR